MQDLLLRQKGLASALSSRKGKEKVVEVEDDAEFEANIEELEEIDLEDLQG